MCTYAPLVLLVIVAILFVLFGWLASFLKKKRLVEKNSGLEITEPPLKTFLISYKIVNHPWGGFPAATKTERVRIEASNKDEAMASLQLVLAQRDEQEAKDLGVATNEYSEFEAVEICPHCDGQIDYTNPTPHRHVSET